MENKFRDFKLDINILKAIDNLVYEKPSSVQK